MVNKLYRNTLGRSAGFVVSRHSHTVLKVEPKPLMLVFPVHISQLLRGTCMKTQRNEARVYSGLENLRLRIGEKTQKQHKNMSFPGV